MSARLPSLTPASGPLQETMCRYLQASSGDGGQDGRFQHWGGSLQLERIIPVKITTPERKVWQILKRQWQGPICQWVSKLHPTDLQSHCPNQITKCFYVHPLVCQSLLPFQTLKHSRKGPEIQRAAPLLLPKRNKAWRYQNTVTEKVG